MKKLVKVALAPQDTDVLFSLENSVSGNLDLNSAIKVIQKDSYNELMHGDALKGREGVIVYMSKEEYDSYKEKGKID